MSSFTTRTLLAVLLLLVLIVGCYSERIRVSVNVEYDHSKDNTQIDHNDIQPFPTHLTPSGAEIYSASAITTTDSGTVTSNDVNNASPMECGGVVCISAAGPLSATGPLGTIGPNW